MAERRDGGGAAVQRLEVVVWYCIRGARVEQHLYIVADAEMEVQSAHGGVRGQVEVWEPAVFEAVADADVDGEDDGVAREERGGFVVAVFLS